MDGIFDVLLSDFVCVYIYIYRKYMKNEQYTISRFAFSKNTTPCIFLQRFSRGDVVSLMLNFYFTVGSFSEER